MNTKELIEAVKNERGSAFQNCNDCEYGIHNGEVIEKLNRLAELEDKIEKGLMIELGYHIRKSYRNHDDQRYKIVVVEENEMDKIGYDGLTREEAEAKLKELQNG